MNLPATVACKVSSEDAGYLTMSPVARVDVPVEELAAKILGVCGKDHARVATILARGSLVSGNARYRWVPIKASESDVSALLDRFPDHDPRRAFDRERCTRMVFHGGRSAVEITREAGSQKRLFRRKSFWDEALPILADLAPRCERHSYADGEDVFTARLTAEALDRVRRLGSLLRFSALAAQLMSLRSATVSLGVRRD